MLDVEQLEQLAAAAEAAEWRAPRAPWRALALQWLFVRFSTPEPRALRR